jgi:hypothetical protein
MISLLDVNGKLVHESAENTNKQIDIETPFANGVYFLKVKTGPHFKTLKLMKVE